MASNNQGHAILDLGIDDLQFTNNDYNTNSNSGNQNSGFTSFPEPEPTSNKDTERIIEDEGSGVTKSSFFKISFYQQYFDVEDKDILTRLMYSMIPVPGKSFLQHHIRPKADLYGPFWVCVTLIFSIAISGNVADYFTTSLLGQSKWQYDFHKVNLAATAVFSYTGLVPACLFGYLWWAGHGGGGLAMSFVEMVCVYGYSLVIYIPVSILWLICVKFSWLQWVLVLVAATLSGIVLFSTVWPAVRESAPKSSVIVMAVILGLHFLLAAGFMLYFFHGSGGDIAPASEVTSVKPVPLQNDTVKLAPAALVQDPTESILNAISSNKYDKDKSTSTKLPITEHSTLNSTSINTANSTVEDIKVSDSTKASNKDNSEIKDPLKSDVKTTNPETLSSSTKNDTTTTEIKESTKESVAKSTDKHDTTSSVEEKIIDNEETGVKAESPGDETNIATNVQSNSQDNSGQT